MILFKDGKAIFIKTKIVLQKHCCGVLKWGRLGLTSNTTKKERLPIQELEQGSAVGKVLKENISGGDGVILANRSFTEDRAG